jgi:predicted dehydrogenase
VKPNLSRRQFLVQSAGIAGASLGIGVGAHAQGDGEIRLGFIGAGDRGRHLLGAALRLPGGPTHPAPGGPTYPAPQVRVTAICDVNPRHLKRGLEIAAAAAARAGGSAAPRGFTNYRALLDEKDVDAVIIATPVHLHAPHALTAVAARKHVYLEKPLAADPAECREIEAAARDAAAAGRIFQIGLQRRYHPRYRRSIQFLHDGEAGTVLFVRAQWHATGNPPRDKPWLFRREKSGDVVVEQACHQFDVLNWLFRAPPLRACGLGGTNRYPGEPFGRDTMDHYGAVLEYPGGAKAHLSHVSYAIPERRFSGIYELVFAERLGIDLANALAWTPQGESRNLLPATEGEAAGSDTELAVQGFLHSVATGKAPEAGAEAGRLATLAALLVRRAMETGRTVEWREVCGEA